MKKFQVRKLVCLLVVFVGSFVMAESAFALGFGFSDLIFGGNVVFLILPVVLAVILSWATLKPVSGVIISGICFFITYHVVGTIANAIKPDAIELAVMLSIMYSMSGIGLMISLRSIWRERG